MKPSRRSIPVVCEAIVRGPVACWARRAMGAATATAVRRVYRTTRHEGSRKGRLAMWPTTRAEAMLFELCAPARCARRLQAQVPCAILPKGGRIATNAALETGLALPRLTALVPRDPSTRSFHALFPRALSLRAVSTRSFHRSFHALFEAPFLHPPTAHRPSPIGPTPPTDSHSAPARATPHTLQRSSTQQSSSLPCLHRCWD